MADDRTIRVRLLAEVNTYVDGMKKAAGATADFGKNVSGRGAAVRKDIEQVGRGAVLMAAGMTVAFGAAAKAAIDWETAWAGVTKTVDGSVSEMAALEDGLRGLATTLPASHKEIAAVAEAAGQLGVEREAIVGFTKTMVDLGETTNLTADQAATSIAQLGNIMGTDLKTETDNFGAALVALGNDGASTEREILDMALRLAGAGKLIGATEADVLGLSNAMASMGIQAELGGGAMSRTLLKIYSAVKDSGEALDAFGEIAGSGGQAFAETFEGAPMKALDEFLKGLNRIESAGGNVIQALKDVGIKGTQDLQVLLRLKGAGDLLADSVELGSKAWMENTALIEEAEKRYDTTASRMKVLKNQVTDVAIEVGDQLLPAIGAVTDAIGTMVTGFGELDSTSRTAITALGGITGAATGVVGIVGIVGPKVKAFQESLGQMGSGGAFLARNLGAVTGGLAAVGAALSIYSYILGRQAQEQAEAAERTRTYTEAIREQGGAIGAMTNKLALDAITVGDVGEALRDTGSDMTIFLDALNTGGPASDSMRQGLQDLADGLRSGLWDNEAERLENFLDLLDEGRLDSVPGLEAEFRRLAESGDVSSGALARLADRTREANEARQQGVIESRNQEAAERAVAEATDENASAAQRAKQALEEQAKAAEEAADAIKELIDAERAAIDPLFAMLDATRGNADANRELDELLKSGKASADEIAAAQENAAKSALDMNGAAITLAGSIAAGTVNVDIAKSMLADWVEQGLISQATADGMATKFDEANEKAKLLAGDKVGTVTVSVTGTGELDTLASKLAAIARDVRVDVTTRVRPGPLAPEARGLVAMGGLVPQYLAFGGQSTGPRGTDTIPAWLTPGEYVLKKSAVDKYGIPALNAMNAGQMFAGATAGPAPTAPGGGGGTTVNVTLAVEGSVHSEESLARATTAAVSKALGTGQLSLRVDSNGQVKA